MFIYCRFVMRKIYKVNYPSSRPSWGKKSSFSRMTCKESKRFYIWMRESKIYVDTFLITWVFHVLWAPDERFVWWIKWKGSQTLLAEGDGRELVPFLLHHFSSLYLQRLCKSDFQASGFLRLSKGQCREVFSEAYAFCAKDQQNMRLSMHSGLSWTSSVTASIFSKI